MPNIVLMGATYPDVPAIDLPSDNNTTYRFYDMDADLAWLGKDVEYMDEVYNEEIVLADTSFNGWTPSTTAKAIVATKSVSPTVSVDMSQYEYAIRWKFDCEPVYNGSETNKARLVRCCSDAWQSLFRRANSLATIQANNLAGNACVSLTTMAILDYYNASSTHTYTWSASYGIYPALTASAFSSTTATSTKITIKTPVINARCSTTYQSTANMGCIDQDNTVIKVEGHLYRYKPQGILCRLYQNLDLLYANPL